MRPDKVAELGEVDSRLVTEASALLPQVKSPTSQVTVKYLEQSLEDESLRRLVERSVAPFASRADWKAYHPKNNVGVLEESSTLYIGPITLVRHMRVPIPIFGDLLPNFNWGSMKLTAIKGESSPDFPWKVGTVFVASLDFDHYYSNGEKSHPEQVELACVSSEKVEANTLHPSFRGDAVKVVCRSSDVRLGPPSETETRESWYLRDPEIILQASYRFEKRGVGFGSGVSQVQMTKIVSADVR